MKISKLRLKAENEALNRKRDESYQRYNDRKAERLQNRININQERMKWNENISKQVLKDIENMTVSDMKREKRTRGLNVATSVITTVGSIALAPFTGFALISTPNPNAHVDASREVRAAKKLYGKKG